jgi:hypothetical protein
MCATRSDPLALCPSAPCDEGGVLLGIVDATGEIGYLRPRLEIDAEFAREANRGRAPGKRFRIAAPCVEGRCAQWTGERCGLIDDLTAQEGWPPRSASSRGLPRCSIRPECRWFAQGGAEACHVCPFVVTDVSFSPKAPVEGGSDGE